MDGSATSPGMMIRFDSYLGSGLGTDDINASVYGCLGVRNNSDVLADSTIFPTYITDTRSLM